MGIVENQLTIPLTKVERNISHTPFDLLEILHRLSESEDIDRNLLNDTAYIRDITKLYHSFHEIHGRLPSVFYELIQVIREIHVDAVAKSFNVKAMRYALSTNDIETTLDKVVFALVFKDRTKDVMGKLRKNGRNINSFIAGLPPKYPYADHELEQWIVKHAGTTPSNVIHDVITFWNHEGFPKNQTIKEMKSFIFKDRIGLEWDMCCSKYPEVFNCKFECYIQQTTISLGSEIVRVLDANDKLQILLGSLTVCCQKLNADGEPAMMEGLVNPHSGFLVFERKGIVIAQAWIWLSESSHTLVLDNIEFADNRSLDSIMDLLRLWLLESPYPNIQMGTGYNELKVGLAVEQNDLEWYRQYWEARYSDAHNRVWLKKDDRLTI